MTAGEPRGWGWGRLSHKALRPPDRPSPGRAPPGPPQGLAARCRGCHGPARPGGGERLQRRPEPASHCSGAGGAGGCPRVAVCDLPGAAGRHSRAPALCVWGWGAPGWLCWKVRCKINAGIPAETRRVYPPKMRDVLR